MKDVANVTAAAKTSARRRQMDHNHTGRVEAGFYAKIRLMVLSQNGGSERGRSDMAA